MPGSRAPSDARTQGALMPVGMGATEDAAARRVIAGRAPPSTVGRVTTRCPFARRRTAARVRAGARALPRPSLRNVVVVDLREDQLFADAERVVAAPVERTRAEAPEVADPRERDRDEPIEELPHPVAAQRYARADRHPLADLEAGDRLPGAAHLRALAGDDRQLLDRRVELLGVVFRLPDSHVQSDLLDPRDLHDRFQAKVVLQLRAQLANVQLYNLWVDAALALRAARG